MKKKSSDKKLKKDLISDEERELFLNAYYQGTIKEAPEKEKTLIHEDAKPAKIIGLSKQEINLFIDAFEKGFVPSEKVVEKNWEAPKRMSGQLAKKRQQVDKTLDLHGYFVEDAVKTLLNFLREQKSRGAKLLLVVHGKGSGALKNAVINLVESHPDVDFFQTAPNRLGGEGAVLIRVNQKRA